MKSRLIGLAIGTIKGVFFVIDSLVDIGLSLYFAALAVLLFVLIAGSIIGALV